MLVTQSCTALCNPMDCTHQAPLSIRFLKQEYMGMSLSKLWDTVKDREAWHGARVAKSRT